ncbi:extensin family protein [Qipengyuania sp. SS22]|uniref:extensin family protein n=1 Tax=Qipengyuania sp. SS22 TaxID=2979461 RepID=UPI0021E57785|nr:extensin family protein [Qipengyuania sp. SS22]UYH53901.1 extensin family protein [Qipengyuania sp. SS22]
MRPHPAFSLLFLLSLAGCGVVPGSKPAERVARQAGSVPVSTARPETRQCNAELGQSGSRFAPLPDKFYGSGCSTTNSVRLERVGGDHSEFAVTNLGAVACPLANSFAGWARYGVDRAAQQILGSPLQRIETMGSFACRNVAGSGRRSAHARAEAIDVAAFVLADGRRISVQSGWNASRDEREFLRVIHRSACKRFGTVLGPDYNRAHHDHFHLEYGDGNYCR